MQPPDTTIREAAAPIDGVREIHDISARTLGERLFISLHCLVDGATLLWQAHEYSDLLEAAIRRAIPAAQSVKIHIEPEDH